MSAPDLLGADEASFGARWRAMTIEERAALPNGERTACYERYRKQTAYIDAGIMRLEREQARAERERTSVAQGNHSADAGASVRLICGNELSPEPINWLWREFLARGKLHMIAGAPGAGKTTIAMSLAATVTAGGRWPDGTRAEPGNVLIWSGEDDPRDTLLPRLLLQGADQSRLYFIGDAMADGKPRPFDPARDMTALQSEAARIGDIHLLIVDPIVNMVAGDSHKNADTRRALQPVVDLAVKLGAAALGVSHFSKGTAGRDPVERVTGSVAFGALPRIVFGAAKSTDDTGRRLFVRAKSNIGPDGGGFGYDLQQADLPGFPGVVASRVLWGGPLNGTARDLLAVAETPANQGERSATDEATDWLRELLAAGPTKAADVQREAKQAGIGEKPLRLARERLRIKPKKSTFAGGWEWGLPIAQGAQDAQVAVSLNEGIFGSKGHLRQSEPVTGEHDGEAF